MAERSDRLETSLRLKAARMLNGHLNSKGQASPFPITELVALPDVGSNGLTVNRLEDIEQMKVDARPWELEKLAQALGMPPDWFGAADQTATSRAMSDVLRVLSSDVQARHQAREEAPSMSGAANRQGRAGEGGVG